MPGNRHPTRLAPRPDLQRQLDKPAYPWLINKGQK